MVTRKGLFCLLLITHGVSSTNWVRLDSTCFLVDKRKVTQQRAIEICQEKGGVLHAVKDFEELLALKSVIDSGNNYWVSVKKISGSFKWGDGRSCCPKNWWGTGEPNSGETCARLYVPGRVELWGHSCSQKFYVLCSKPFSWSLVNSIDYYLDDLCGVEIMPNCEDLPCVDVCQAHHDCDQFAKMLNVCVNIKHVSQTDNCVVKLRSNLQLYRKNC